MDNAFPLWLTDEQRAVEAQIRAAFRGVSRAGGVSWSESVVADGYGSESARERAKAEDKDESWEQLVDDPAWRVEFGVGGFSFLDPIGFRYYLAPAMIRALTTREADNISFALYFDPPPSCASFKREKVALIDPAQARAIYAFLRFMVLREALTGVDLGQVGWSDCLDNYWRQFA